MSERMKLRDLDINSIVVPDVRITSSWDPELLEYFRASVKNMGIQDPIVVVQDGTRFFLVDGLHRLQEAKLHGKKKISAAVDEGSLKDVMLKNLVLNRLRGKTKSSDMVRVVLHLLEKQGVNYEEIAKTGLSREFIDKIVKIHENAIREVKEALDEEKISVSHAYEISKIRDEASQKRLLSLVMRYSLNAQDLADVARETLRILEEREKQPQQVESPPPTIPTEDTIVCHLCERERPLKYVRGFNACLHCFGVAQEAVKLRLAEIEAKYEVIRRQAQMAAGQPGGGVS